MSLRNLAIDIMFNSEANKIINLNSAIDEVKSNALEAKDNVDTLSVSVDGLGNSAGVGKLLVDNWKEITAATVAVGGAMIAVTNRSNELNSGLRRIQAITGESAESLREMTMALTDHTFTNDDAVAAMEELIKVGVRTKDEFEALLPVFDTYADATGKHITEGIREFDTVLSALDIPLSEAADHLDTFSWLTTQTTVNMGDLGRVMRREQANIRDMGLSVDEIAVAMGALEAEGIKGPRAVMAFQSAIQDAEGDIDAFWRGLGVTSEALATQNERLLESEGLTQALADANNQSLGIWDKFKKGVDDAMWSVGSFIEPVKDLGPLMMGIGPMIKGVAVAKAMMTKAYLAGIPAIKASTIATLAFGKALLLNPITWVIAGIVALVAAGWLLWKNWDTVTEYFSGAWVVIKDKGSQTIDWFKALPAQMLGIGKDIVDGLKSGIKAKANELMSSVTDLASGVANRFKGFFGISSPSKLMMEYGADIQEGLQIGMDNNQAEIPTPSTSSTTNNASSNIQFSPKIDIVIHGSSPEVAQDVRKEIERALPDLFDQFFATLGVRVGVADA